MGMNSGMKESLPYSLSRYTDVPAAKWAWMRQALTDGYMVGFDPRNAIPSRWSLHPSDTLGLAFWTKDPTNLIKDRSLLDGHRVKVHLTATGWHEVETGAPSIEEASDLLHRTVDAFGPDNVTWRFSPVPVLPSIEVTHRFNALARAARRAGLRRVYLSFIQQNDLMQDGRDEMERVRLLAMLSAWAEVRVVLCNEDRLFHDFARPPDNCESGVCVPPTDFALTEQEVLPSEGCGCVLMVDPFTINESCTMGCRYCYAADKSLADKKRNTTRGLRVL